MAIFKSKRSCRNLPKLFLVVHANSGGKRIILVELLFRSCQKWEENVWLGIERFAICATIRLKAYWADMLNVKCLLAYECRSCEASASGKRFVHYATFRMNFGQLKSVSEPVRRFGCEILRWDSAVRFCCAHSVLLMWGSTLLNLKWIFSDAVPE